MRKSYIRSHDIKDFKKIVAQRRKKWREENGDLGSYTVSEKEFKRALLLSYGIQITTSHMLGISRQSVHGRLKRHPHLEEYRQQVRGDILVMAVSGVIKRARAANLDACRMLITLLGGEHGLYLKERLEVQQQVTGGLLILPAEIPLEKWLKMQKEHRLKSEKEDGGAEARELLKAKEPDIDPLLIESGQIIDIKGENVTTKRIFGRK